MSEGEMPRQEGDYYFAAVSMEGTGVRYYGEYCMVLAGDARPTARMQIVDRDSYEIVRTAELALWSSLSCGSSPSCLHPCRTRKPRGHSMHSQSG